MWVVCHPPLQTSPLQFPARLDKPLDDGFRQRGVADEDAAVVIAGLEVGAQSKVALQRGLGTRAEYFIKV